MKDAYDRFLSQANFDQKLKYMYHGNEINEDSTIYFIIIKLN